MERPRIRWDTGWRRLDVPRCVSSKQCQIPHPDPNRNHTPRSQRRTPALRDSFAAVKSRRSTGNTEWSLLDRKRLHPRHIRSRLEVRWCFSLMRPLESICRLAIYCLWVGCRLLARCRLWARCCLLAIGRLTAEAVRRLVSLNLKERVRLELVK